MPTLSGCVLGGVKDPKDTEKPESPFFLSKELANYLGQELNLSTNEKLAIMVGYLYGSIKDT